MIEVQNLVKRYGSVTAVDDLSFTIEKGRIYGFLGPNGAGKSTTMNILTGCLGATEGTVKIDGHDIFEEPIAAKKCIGYLPEMPPLYTDMTPDEYLRFVLQAKGVPKDQWETQLAAAMDKTQIAPVRGRLIRNLSKGYRQRVGIAQALLGNPEVIILDEPTVGLDPAQIIEIRELIRTLGQDHTVILSSHILPEVSAICDHIMIIAHGRLVASDTPENLEKLFAGNATVAVEASASEAECRAILAPHTDLGEVTYKALDEGHTRITIASEGEQDAREALFFAFADARKPILEMTRVRASLEDIFLELTRNAEADNAARDKKKARRLRKSAKETPEEAPAAADSGEAAAPSAPAQSPAPEAAPDGKEGEKP